MSGDVNRFAFVIHPLSLDFVHRHRHLGWTRRVPDTVVERVSAHLPPMQLSTIVGGRSPTTGQRIEGYLYTLGATPREMMRRGASFTYRRLGIAAEMAAARGAGVMGLGAFTSVIGDAGITVAERAPIAVTSGNSLTVSATLEAAKQAVRRMGHDDLATGRAMVVGATGSIGSVCARLIAQAIRDVVLVSIEPERLEILAARIREETPEATVVTALRPDEHLGQCDLVVTATSAFGERILDVSRCKPGAVVCDVARPPDISEEEAAVRPDVLVIESGEVVIPGEVDLGYDVGLPPGVAYACLAETALLAMEGRFESYTLGRELEIDRVKEINQLFRKHGLRIAGLRSFGRELTDADFDRRRAEAERLRRDPDRFAELRQRAADALGRIPARAKGAPPVRSGWLRRAG